MNIRYRQDRKDSKAKNFTFIGNKSEFKIVKSKKGKKFAVFTVKLVVPANFVKQSKNEKSKHYVWLNGNNIQNAVVAKPDKTPVAVKKQVIKVEEIINEDDTKPTSLTGYEDYDIVE